MKLVLLIIAGVVMSMFGVGLTIANSNYTPEYGYSLTFVLGIFTACCGGLLALGATLRLALRH